MRTLASSLSTRPCSDSRVLQPRMSEMKVARPRYMAIFPLFFAPPCAIFYARTDFLYNMGGKVKYPLKDCLI